MTGPTADTGVETGAECQPVLSGAGCLFDGAEAGACDTGTAAPDEVGPLAGELGGGGLCGCQAASPVSGPWGLLVLVALVRRWTWLWALGCLLAWGAPVQAQVDAQRLQIHDGGDFPALWEGDLGPAWSGAFTVSMNDARNLAVLEGVPGAGVLLNRVVSWEGHLSLNVGRVLRVGASMPLHAITFSGLRLSGLRSGDLAAWVAIPLTGAKRKVQSAWMIKFDVPTGQTEWLLGDTGVITGMFSSTFPAGPFEGLVNLGAALQQEVALPGAVWGSHWVYGVGLRAEPAGPTWVTAELYGNAPVQFWSGPPSVYPLEVLLSGGAVATRFVSIGAGVGTGITRGLGSPSFRLIAMLDVRPRVERDQDEDGIPDMRDLCRRVPEDRDGYRDRDGCPDKDNDSDGFVDSADSCPTEPETVNGFQDLDGCPDRSTALEIEIVDQEGLEQVDVRVGASRPVTVFAGETLRRRLQLDSVEVEVAAPGFVSSVAVVELPGTPIRHVVRLEPIRVGVVQLEVVDVEGRPLDAQVRVGDDGVARSSAQPVRHPAGVVTLRVSAPRHLPRTLEVAVPPDQTVALRVVLRPTTVREDAGTLRLSASIRFDKDAAELDEAGRGLVEALAEWLVAHPEVALLRVEGHADPSGGSRYNYELSLRRAQAVMSVLVAEGIDQERLQAIGSGEVRGLESAQELDRRVEFVVLVWDDQRSSVPPVPPR